MGMLNLYEIIMFIFIMGITGIILMTYTSISIELFYNYKTIKHGVDELNKSYDCKLKELQNEIKKVEESNDFLNDYIDII